MTSASIYAGRGLVYNPFAQMDAQITAASNDVADVFSEIDSALDSGSSISGAVRRQKIDATVMRLVSSARLHGFLHGVEHSRKQMPATYGRTIRDAGEKRAARVNRLMRRTSKRVLRNSPDSEHVLSKDRAVGAMRFEAAKSYFNGVRDAFQGKAGWGKRWVTSSAESCIECSANEDQDVINAQDYFQSGHDYPVAHNNCSCFISMVRL